MIDHQTVVTHLELQFKQANFQDRWLKIRNRLKGVSQGKNTTMEQHKIPYV